MWWSRCCRFLVGMIGWVCIGEPQSAAHHTRCPVVWRPAAASAAHQHRHPRPSRSCWSARKRSRCDHRHRHHRTRSAAQQGTVVFLVVRLRKKRLCRACCRRRRSTRTSWRWHTGCRGGCRGGCSWMWDSPWVKGGRSLVSESAVGGRCRWCDWSAGFRLRTRCWSRRRDSGGQKACRREAVRLWRERLTSI